MHVALDGIESRGSVRIEGSGFGAQDSGSMVLSFGAVGLRVFCGCAFDCEAIGKFCSAQGISTVDAVRHKCM